MSEYRTYEQMYAKYFRNSSDSAEMNVNGSVTPQYFDINGVLTGPIEVYHINIAIRDAGAQLDYFGGIASGLTNGLKLEMYDSGDNVVFDWFDGLPIKNNYEFEAVSSNEVIYEAAAGDDLINIQFNLLDEGGPLILPYGYYVRFTVQDNLTALSEFRAMAHGMKR